MTRPAPLLLLVATLAGAAAALASAGAAAQRAEFSAGFGVSNGTCGSAEPTATLAYDLDADRMPAHFRLAAGPDGSCEGQAVSVDALIEARHYFRDRIFAVGGAGYDRRSVPFEFEATAWGTKQFRGVEVEAAQALLGLGFDGGDWSCQVAYNAVEARLQAGGRVLPIQANCRALLGAWDLSGTTSFDIHTLAASFRAGRVELAAEAAFGFHRLENPAPDHLEGDVRYGRADPPSPLYSASVRYVF